MESEKKKPFSLGDTLAEVLGAVPDPDTVGPEKLEYLPIVNVDPDEANFYSLEGIDDLAENIECVGLQQPLRVRANPDMPGRWLIVSGHRRRAALWKLYEEDPERWARVPCIVEAAAGSEQLQRLRLIYANSDTRVMSSADVSRQAVEVERLLYELKEQGYEFPGRMRDHVAEACRVSKTKLATMKVIREKLLPELRAQWEADRISEEAAYIVARLPEERQRDLLQVFRMKDGSIRRFGAREAEVRAKDAAKIRGIVCKKTKGACENAERMIEKLSGTSSWGCATCTRCCADCRELETCRSVCKRCKQKQAGLKAKTKEEKQAREAEEERKIAPKRERLHEIWRRWDAARREAGKTIEEAYKAGKCYYVKTDEQKIEAILSGERKLNPWTDGTPYHHESVVDLMAVCDTADLFGVSTDYLLGRTEDMTPWRPVWISVDDHYPEEGQFVMAVDRSGTMQPAVYFRARFMDATPRSLANNEIPRVELWMPRPALPDGRTWQGEETLRSMLAKRMKE